MGCDDKCGCAVPCPGGTGCSVCPRVWVQVRVFGEERRRRPHDVLVRRPLRVQPVQVRPRVAADGEGEPEGRLLLRRLLHLRLLRLHHHHRSRGHHLIHPSMRPKMPNETCLYVWLSVCTCAMLSTHSCLAKQHS
nr:expressed protein [Oryza sativa Japonica Group]